MGKSLIFFVSCLSLVLSLECSAEVRPRKSQESTKQSSKKKEKDIWSEDYRPPININDGTEGYFQVGGGLGFLIEYLDLKTAWGFSSSLGLKTSSGWGGELFFNIIPDKSNASFETRTIAADSKILGVAPTHTWKFDQLQLRLGLGVGYLVVNRSYFFNPGSSEESLYRWSLAPALEVGLNLSPSLYAHLGCRAIFTIAQEKHVNEPRIILPSIGLGYKF